MPRDVDLALPTIEEEAMQPMRHGGLSSKGSAAATDLLTRDRGLRVRTGGPAALDDRTRGSIGCQAAPRQSLYALRGACGSAMSGTLNADAKG